MIKKLNKKVIRHYRQGSLFRVSANVIKKNLNFCRFRSRVFLRDLRTKLKYGLSAPLHMETIWVDPNEVQGFVTREEIMRITGLSRNEASGQVINWDDVQEMLPVRDQLRIQYCLKHWQEGISWGELGVYDYMSKTKKYGNDPMETIIKRFEVLDQAYEETKRFGRLKSRQEVAPSTFREKEGVLIHIGKNGVPYFGGNGYHRFAIALALNLRSMPACIGVVDKDAVQYLHKYRQPTGRG